MPAQQLTVPGFLIKKVLSTVGHKEHALKKNIANSIIPNLMSPKKWCYVTAEKYVNESELPIDNRTGEFEEL